ERFGTVERIIDPQAGNARKHPCPGGLADRGVMIVEIGGTKIEWTRDAVLDLEDLDRLVIEPAEVKRLQAVSCRLICPSAGVSAVFDLPIGVVVEALERRWDIYGDGFEGLGSEGFHAFGERIELKRGVSDILGQKGPGER